LSPRSPWRVCPGAPRWAISRRLPGAELPLEGDLLVNAANPADGTQARLVNLAWTLFLDDEETVSGLLEELTDLALAAAGAGEPQRKRLEAVPSIQTPLGPMRYPSPIRIEYEVGSVLD